jgi:hypothetical protein
VKHLKIVAFFLLTILVACSLIGAVDYVRHRNDKRQYDEFLLAERKTISMFDALNEDVVENLPELPLGSTLEKKWSVGIDAPLYEHGRWLWMEIATTQTTEYILEYYGSFLLKNGWQENKKHHAFEDAFYYRKASCIEINPPINQNAYYRILIWQDFRNQDFSPQIPDMKIMSRLEMGMTDIATCP